MNKFVKICIVVCIVLLGMIAFRHMQESASPEDIEQEQARDATILDPDLAEITTQEDAINIAVKGINLTQGESGEESWRLNASSASFDQESGKVIISRPKITYFLKEESKLYIESRLGRLDQTESLVEMWDDVQVDEADNHLTSSRAVYNGKTHIIVLPEPLNFNNPQFSGSASQADWDLNSNVITASGNVQVRIAGEK
ncbi:MAG: LPS export ABC transporter periplasmic protein LptC [Desulfovibrionaceae bacterium]|nr:LPS export ABC transporter periplasmic protein LptC [Desulfovibrionaceae bacterium]